MNSTTNIVEPRFNEVPMDWANWFVNSRARYIEVCFPYILLRLYFSGLKNIVRFTEDFVI